MDDQQKTELVEATEMKLLSGSAHEYVVNFRNRFLTYFALPLFLLFIALALTVSWLVFVPVRSEHAITLNQNKAAQLNVQLTPAVKQFVQKNYNRIAKASIDYRQSDGTEVNLDCEVTQNGKVELSNRLADFASKQPVNATLVLFIDEERFIFKLLDELAKNLKVKKPASIEPDQP
ncbi:MAG: hypothetical protein HEP71_25325 [Roseivirga sp.]|nr:hypothetical protein [Roseivirga sp.]